MMKTMLIGAALLCFAGPSAVAQDYGLHWKYKDYPGAITFSVGDPFLHMASWGIDEPLDRRLFNRIDKIRILVFENYSPIKKADVEKFQRKAAQKHMEDLVYVRDGHTHVRIMVKEKKSAIRRIVFLVQEPEAFVLGAVRGKLKYEDINRFLKEAESNMEVPEMDELRNLMKGNDVIRM